MSTTWRRRCLRVTSRSLWALLLAAPTGWVSAQAPAQVPAPPPAETAPTAPPPTDTGPAELTAEDRKFLDEAGPLLTDAEREAFIGLSRAYRRQAFIERFWRTRDPFPRTGRNELRDAWEQRLEIARTRYDDLNDARPRHLLLYGEPQEVQEVRCAGVLRPLEVWSYNGSYVGGGGFHLIFYRVGGDDPWRLWDARDGLDVLFDDVRRSGGSQVDMAQTIRTECFRGDQLVRAMERTLDVQSSPSPVPEPGDEWLRTFLAASTDLPEDAEPLAATLTLDYPGKRQSRTVVQGVVEVEAGKLSSDEELGGTYNLVVDGEILRDGELFESFRYRFQFASDAPPDARLPMIFERYLRPGDYKLVLRARDLASDKVYREERELAVPSQPTARAALPREAPAGADPAASEDSAATPDRVTSTVSLAEANATVNAGDQTLRILPPLPGLRTGSTRVEARVQGEGVERVRFLLNGRQVMSKRNPPYSVELPLGDTPRLHRVTVVAVGADGDEVARDELMLNAGPHRFAVRLVEPRRGGTYRQSLRARAEVEVPEGEQLERVEFFLNDTLIATLYQPPFIQPVAIPPGDQVAYVQAKAYLVDGNTTEDLVFVNAPEYLEEVDIQFVELYTTVVDRRGRPVEGLTQDQFRVVEDGEPQEIRRFERVTDQPIYAGLVLDTSASMSEELDAVVKGALQFFREVLTPKDRAAVVTFADTHDLAVRFTNNPDVLAGGVAGLEADGETALFDSLVYSLYYFSGVKGKRALILLSDGEDSVSRYGFDTVLDYARRTGVAIYTIGLGLPASEKMVEIQLQRLASETGGRWFLVDRVNDLDEVYDVIERELRAQYLITYQSSQEGDTFREVEVTVAAPGQDLEAKTLRGYYP